MTLFEFVNQTIAEIKAGVTSVNNTSPNYYVFMPDKIEFDVAVRSEGDLLFVSDGSFATSDRIKFEVSVAHYPQGKGEK